MNIAVCQTTPLGLCSALNEVIAGELPTQGYKLLLTPVFFICSVIDLFVAEYSLKPLVRP
jgi:hypothetical protein